MAAEHTLPLSGMIPMYLLMSAFHSPPWYVVSRVKTPYFRFRRFSAVLPDCRLPTCTCDTRAEVRAHDAHVSAQDTLSRSDGLQEST
jgi:hypothetical protein